MEDKDKTRLWIGNLDEKITEYQLLKMVQKYGDIEKFDLLYHRNGPLAGKSRGYAFVTYKCERNAEKALAALNGIVLAGKTMFVKYAHTESKDDDDSKYKPFLQLPALAGPKEKPTAQNQSAKISAIERKLQMMEKKSDLDSFLLEQPVAKKPNLQMNKTNLRNDLQRRKT